MRRRRRLQCACAAAASSGRGFANSRRALSFILSTPAFAAGLRHLGAQLCAGAGTTRPARPAPLCCWPVRRRRWEGLWVAAVSGVRSFGSRRQTRPGPPTRPNASLEAEESGPSRPRRAAWSARPALPDGVAWTTGPGEAVRRVGDARLVPKLSPSPTPGGGGGADLPGVSVPQPRC